MKIAVVQMRGSASLEKNLESMDRATASAARRGAETVAFPEMAYFTAPGSACVPVTARYEELVGFFSGIARKHRVCLLPGTLREPSGTGQPFNTLLALSPEGERLAKYRKIFLFRAKLPDRVYDESKLASAGREVSVFQYQGITFGLAICYDLRFPELFRALKKRGAQIVFIPSAFTVPTGKAHWETLLRARAIENQFTIAAPALVGRSGNGAVAYGHSLVVNEWGKVECRGATTPKTLFFSFTPLTAVTFRDQVDAWACRREDLFPIR